MYIRVYEGLGQTPKELREFEEDKRRFEMAKAEHEKRLAPLALGILPLDVLKRAGLKTNSRVNN